MLTPAEFLLARVIDLEAKAWAAARNRDKRSRWVANSLWVFTEEPSADRPYLVCETGDTSPGQDRHDLNEVRARHIATWDPAFVLAWCTAVRQVCTLYAPDSPNYQSLQGKPIDQALMRGYQGAVEDVLLALLQPFVDHPDFDPTWRTET